MFAQGEARSGMNQGLRFCVAATVLAFGFMAHAEDAGSAALSARREKAQRLRKDGNIKEAWEVYRPLALDPTNPAEMAADDFREAMICLAWLIPYSGRVLAEDGEQLADNLDYKAFRGNMLAAHREKWPVIAAVASSYRVMPRQGFDSLDRDVAYDRTRALQLMTRAIELAAGKADDRQLAALYIELAGILIKSPGNTSPLEYPDFRATWRLQQRTDLSGEVDEREEEYGDTSGVPVEPDGMPVYFRLPDSFESARNDGERWRWALARAAELDPALKPQLDLHYGTFLQDLFGIHTCLRFEDGRYDRGEDGDRWWRNQVRRREELAGLGTHETWAHLATGDERLTLPDEFNFIRVYERAAAGAKSVAGEMALSRLARVFENRCQYDTAAGYWRRSIAQYGDPAAKKRECLAQLIEGVGRFERADPFPAGRNATVRYCFRNATNVHFEVRTIDMLGIIEDFKTCLESKPANPDDLLLDRFDSWEFDRFLSSENGAGFVGDVVAAWNLKLQPDPRRFDSRIRVEVPMLPPGTYRLSATHGPRSVSQLVLRIADTAILEKKLERGPCFFIVDAVSGQPLPGMGVELIGHTYSRHALSDEKKKPVQVKVVAMVSDENGQVMPDVSELQQSFSWLVCATNSDGRLAYEQSRYGRPREEPPGTKSVPPRVFTITDRPVYRPGQTVSFKMWLRESGDDGDVSRFTDRRYDVAIVNSRDDRVFKGECVTDTHGGLNGSFSLPDDARLGTYRIFILNPVENAEGRRTSWGDQGTFRVEEYKKPEMEVTIVPPEEPTLIGEKVTVVVKAKYLFGAPVTKAIVRYSVRCHVQAAAWYPEEEWDWLYGRGYKWTGLDRSERAAAMRRAERGRSYGKDIDEGEAEIGPDGTLAIEIDTASDAEAAGEEDLLYAISVEVADESRRHVETMGSILVPRRPFVVHGWGDRGYYEVGGEVRAHFRVGTAQGTPVQGKGRVRLIKVARGNDAPVETRVFVRNLDADTEGVATLAFRAEAAGQYRLSYAVTDERGHREEGQYSFLVRGDATAARGTGLALIPEKPHYAPGETVRLLVDGGQPGRTVLLFLRPRGGLWEGVYAAPRILRIAGRSEVVEIPVAESDIPSFQVEALSVWNARLESDRVKIHVPPVRKILQVAAEPSAAVARPGDKATVGLKVLGSDGKPVQGTAVLSVYDKAVEYFVAGAPPPDIKRFFWMDHWDFESPYTRCSLAFYAYNRVPPGGRHMDDHGYVSAPSIGSDIEALSSPTGIASNLLQWVKAKRAYESSISYCMADGPSVPPLLDVIGATDAEDDLAVPRLRKAFADTACWAPSLAVDDDGRATVDFTMPDNLTTWRIRGWVMGEGMRVGYATAEMVSSKDLLLRLQAPRFFVEKDETTLSANVHNYLSAAKSVHAALELDGERLAPVGTPSCDVTVASNDQERVDWRVRALTEGETTVRVKALTDEESDAVEMAFPVHVHGMTKTEARCGVVRPGEGAASVAFNIPRERREELSRLEVRFSPTLAGSVVDALPYLAEYPYGCVEQTLNRFLPAVIVQNVLRESGFDLKTIREKSTNLNAQELGSADEQGGRRQQGQGSAVFDEEKLNRKVEQGVRRLYDMARGDDGWGWFSRYGEPSDPYMTAYVVHGLQRVTQATGDEGGWRLEPCISEGTDWLKRYQKAQVRRLSAPADKSKRHKRHADNLDAFVFMVLCDAGERDGSMLELLYRDRQHLSTYGLAMFGLALHTVGEQDKLAMVQRNIEQFLVTNDRNQTAFLALPERRRWWSWCEDEIETHACYLKLLVRTEPKSEKTSRIVKYLVTNRRSGAHWKSTRDTALCIEAIAEYLKASGEDQPDMTVSIVANGETRKEVTVTRENLFTFDNTLVLRGDALRTGKQEITVRRKGRGPVYFNGYLSNFTLEDPIAAAGTGLRIARKYFKLVRGATVVTEPGPRGEPREVEVPSYDRVEVTDDTLLKSGDLVEVQLTLSSANDHEHVMVEDMKAAGLEPDDVISGYKGGPLCPYVEMRDDRVVFLIQSVPRGRHVLTYRLRAETPGRYSALPAVARGMYAAELQANSAEAKLSIED